MAYIGKTPVIGNFQVCDAISVVNNQAAYTMQVGGVNVSPESSQHMLVSLNGVIQKNGGTNPSFTVSGSTITFASNLVTGDVINFIQILGNVLDLGVPSDATVSTAKIVDANVTAAKMFSGFANGITEADLWRLTSSLNSNADPISSNLERVDDASFEKIGTGMSVSSGIWTFPSTGIYQVTVSASYEFNNDNANINVYATQNNSSYDLIAWKPTGMDSNHNASAVAETFVDVTNVSNVKVKFTTSGMAGSGATILKGDTDATLTSFKFIRLGDT
jgi:hypothetical protein